MTIIVCIIDSLKISIVNGMSKVARYNVRVGLSNIVGIKMKSKGTMVI